MTETDFNYDIFLNEEQKREADGFVQAVIDTGVPVDIANLKYFALNVLGEKGYPTGFLPRLASCFSYITEDEFYGDLGRLGDIIGDLSDSEVIFEHRGSGLWIYEQMLARLNIGSAKTVNILRDDDQRNSRVSSDSRRLVILDDWMFTGVQLRDDILRPIIDVLKDKDDPRELEVFLMYGNPALSLESHGVDLSRVKLHVLNPERISLVQQILNEEQWNFLGKLTTRYANGYEDDDRVSCTCGWWCIPDNIPAVLGRNGSDIYKGFKKPYSIISL